MHKSIVAFSGMALTLLLLAPLAAQEQGRGPGGGRGGFGGEFGGGFGGQGGGGGGSLLMLVRMPAVQEEIEMVDDQRRQLQQIAESLRPEFNRNIRDLSEEERRAAFAEMQASMEKAAKEAQGKLTEVLLPHQMERLQQISLQVRGPSALSDPEVAAKLKLTDQQKEQIETAQTGMRDKMRQIFESGNRENMREQMEAARREVEQQAVAVLTSEQKTQWEEMKGEAFAMPEGEFGRGRGGFRGGEGERGPGGGRRPQREGAQP